MKKVLIVYHKMVTGGSTTSLLSLLQLIDTRKYNVDLLLFHGSGEYEAMIPKNIHVLPYAYKYQSPGQVKLHKAFNPKFIARYVYTKLAAEKHKYKRWYAQSISIADEDFYRKPDGEYDVAIGFLEGYCNQYIVKNVNAKKKIMWFHLNYKECMFDPDFDRKTFGVADKVVLVSEKCKGSFDEMFPEYKYKSVVVENILTNSHLRNLAAKPVAISDLDPERINLVTVCRIAFASKGLDRAITALAKIKSNKEAGFNRLHWYIIGDGIDMDELKRMIVGNDLSFSVTLLGLQGNPYPFLTKMTLFFLPSRFEGKPMSVTEAQMLGLPALVTEYSSAREQVSDGIDGMVMENSDNGIYNGLMYILGHPETISEWKKNVMKRDYSNENEIHTIEALIDGKV